MSPLSKEITEGKKVRRKLAEVAVDSIQEQLALEKKNAALTARCARLAGASEALADWLGRSMEWPKEHYGWDLVRAVDAALAADDAKLAERWRAMERVCHVAEDCRRIEYPDELIKALDELAEVEKKQ